MEAVSKPIGLVRSFLIRNSLTFKMGWVLILVLVMLIPLSMIRSVLQERMARRNEAVAGITSTWGNDQSIVGPVLVIPYQYRSKVWKDQIIGGRSERIEVEDIVTANAYFLPSELAINGTVNPNKLRRGIYEAVVYRGNLDISGHFPHPDFAQLGIPENNVQWNDAMLTLAVSDLRGTGEMLNIKIAGQTIVFSPGCKLNGYSSGITARLPNIFMEKKNLDFRMALNLKGSSGIRFAPVGQHNQVILKSPWRAPSFGGAFLPEKRKFDAKGFESLWEISWYGRNYPQQSIDQPSGQPFNADIISPSLFGVNFIVPVDMYRMVERAIKYGVLFIALIFTAFFLFEVLSALSIHTIQYTLVGAALCLFYLAVLALSEFIPFHYAYGIGAIASTLLIVLYCLRVLRSGKRTAVVAMALIAIYGYLYIILQLQDYSLLFGTVALFVVLGIVMYSTRNLDWSRRGNGDGPVS